MFPWVLFFALWGTDLSFTFWTPTAGYTSAGPGPELAIPVCGEWGTQGLVQDALGPGEDPGPSKGHWMVSDLPPSREAQGPECQGSGLRSQKGKGSIAGDGTHTAPGGQAGGTTSVGVRWQRAWRWT